MNVGLFIPCYINQFYPQVGIATLELLERLKCNVYFPERQTCCGQPLANSGMEQEAKKIYQHYVNVFANADYIVMPSPSCTYHIRHHYNILEQTHEVKRIRKQTLDLSEFLIDVLQIEKLNANFPHRVGFHKSCHGLRGLRLGKSSEIQNSKPAQWEKLLQMVDGIQILKPDHEDECCGFGGTFSVFEGAMSAKMGKDKVKDHLLQGAEYITSGDMSCLMHLEGIIRRQKLDLRVIHLVEILNSTQALG